MSTQDDGVPADVQALADEIDAAENGEVKPTETPQSVDAETSEDAKPKGEVSNDETEATQDGVLNPVTRKLVDDASRLSSTQRAAKIESLEKSGREEQVKAAKELRDIFPDDAPVQRVAEVPTNQSDIDAAVTKALEARGIKEETFEKFARQAEDSERRDAADSIIKDRGLDVSTDDALAHRDFLRHFHDPSNEGSLKNKTELAMFKAFGAGVTPDPAKTQRAESMASAPPTTSETTSQKIDFSNMDSIESLRGMNLDDIAKL